VLAIDWQHDDRLGFGARYDSLDGDTPLKALRAGIRSRTLRLGAAWRQDEGRLLRAWARLSRFSDGNGRRSLDATWHERWWSGPRFKLDTVAAIGFGDNTLATAPYFNPDGERTAAVTAELRWRTWRRYQRVFEQALAVTAGVYRQNDFGSGPLWSVRYGHRLERENHLDLVYGIAWSSRPYDGRRESETSFYLTLETSF
jgi:biofilm PGA synthesis protein PgaA